MMDGTIWDNKHTPAYLPEENLSLAAFILSTA